MAIIESRRFNEPSGAICELGLTLTDCSYSDKKTEKKNWETCYILDPRKKPSAEDLEAICRMHPLVISFPASDRS